MIKVLHLIHGLNMGGAETLLKEYVLRINKQLFDVTVLCYEKKKSPYEEILKENGIRVINVADEMPLYGKRDVISKVINKRMRYGLIKKYIKAIHPDIIHAHLTVNSLLKFAKPSYDTKIVYTQHYSVETWKDKHIKDLEAAKWLLRHYEMKFIALNEEMRDEINELFDVDETLVFNNGIDLELFQNGKRKNEIRNILGISSRCFVVGHVGRFADVKNHKFLLDIFAEVCKEKDDAVLLIVGRGEKEQEIIEKATALGIEANVMILHDRTDIPDILKAMDVFVFPSKQEGLGISVIEAQVAGVPCIVSDSVPRATQISNKIEYLCLSESKTIWSQCCVKMADTDNDFRYIDLEKWDIKKIVSDLETLYLDLHLQSRVNN